MTDQTDDDKQTALDPYAEIAARNPKFREAQREENCGRYLYEGGRGKSALQVGAEYRRGLCDRWGETRPGSANSPKEVLDPTTMTTALRLVRANKSRGGDWWSRDDYDVCDGNRVIGRIMLHPQAPKDQPWFWTITAREAKPSVYNKGYAASREQAMADFKARWLATTVVALECPTPR